MCREKGFHYYVPFLQTVSSAVFPSSNEPGALFCQPAVSEDLALLLTWNYHEAMPPSVESSDAHTLFYPLRQMQTETPA
jgi:hypothetical protein